MEKNKILKILSTMLIVCLLGYTQIGCQSKEEEYSNSQLIKEETAKALPQIIKYFKDNGYEFKTLV